MRKTYALITGATSGIGFEFSRILSEYGYNLVLVARNEKKLQYLKKEFSKLYNVNIEYFPMDLCNEDEINELYEACISNDIDVEFLVNNAGFGLYGEFLESSYKQQTDMVKLNVEALTHLTHLFAYNMKQKKRGYILNVSSIASLAPGPYMTVYYATKAYVSSFTEGLKEELKKYHIKVCAVCPGPVKTNFWNVAGVKKSNFLKFVFEEPGDVAYKAVKGIFNNKTIIYSSFFGILMCICAKILPRFIVRKLTVFANNKL